MASVNRSWNDLPVDLLERIGIRLNTETDVSHFLAVCKSWRSSLPPQPALSITVRNTKHDHTTCFLRETIVYRLAPPTHHHDDWVSWVIKLRKRSRYGSGTTHMILHPLSETPFKIDQIPKPLGFQKKLNLLEHQVFEVAKSFRLYPMSDYPIYGYYRAAMSSDCLMIVHTETLYNCRLNDDRRGVHLLKINPISSGFFSEFRYEDVIFYKDKFYLVGRHERSWTTLTCAVDSSLKVTRIIRMPHLNSCFYDKKYLVESLGELLLVCRFPDKIPEKCTLLDKVEVRFKVFKLDEAVVDGGDDADEKQWVQMETLEDRILFVSSDCCFSVAAKDFPRCKGNSIYFCDPALTQFCRYNSTSRIYSDIGVYNFSDGSFCPLAYYRDYRNIFCPPAFAWSKKQAKLL